MLDWEISQTTEARVPEILLLDDEPDLLDILKPEFEDVGFTVDAFTKPEDALVSLKAKSYTLVISDIRMPKMNGLQVMTACQQELAVIPKFIFYTGFSDYSDQELLDAGAMKVFKKPLNFEEFFNFVEGFLRNSK